MLNQNNALIIFLVQIKQQQYNAKLFQFQVWFVSGINKMVSVNS